MCVCGLAILASGGIVLGLRGVRVSLEGEVNVWTWWEVLGELRGTYCVEGRLFHRGPVSWGEDD
jgi:hypothetical protein